MPTQTSCWRDDEFVVDTSASIVRSLSANLSVNRGTLCRQLFLPPAGHSPKAAICGGLLLSRNSRARDPRGSSYRDRDRSLGGRCLFCQGWVSIPAYSK